MTVAMSIDDHDGYAYIGFEHEPNKIARMPRDQFLGLVAAEFEVTITPNDPQRRSVEQRIADATKTTHPDSYQAIRHGILEDVAGEVDALRAGLAHLREAHRRDQERAAAQIEALRNQLAAAGTVPE